MILELGNMWSAYKQADLFLFTGNSTITHDGRLVMGRGMAREVRDRFPGIDLKMGQTISRESLNTNRGRVYGLLVSAKWPKAKLGAFQVKYHFSDQADLGLIEQSSAQLVLFGLQNPESQIHLNFPGIGNGGLSPEVVMPILRERFDRLENIHIWVRSKEALDRVSKV